MPNVDSTLRQIAQWTYIIHTDLTSAFYQIPLAKASMKYCGVVTPFKGVRVYARSAMGMPGSETALEELMCRILGDLIQAGIVVKLADDLFCGGNTPETLLSNWRQVLSALHLSNMRLSAHKTTVARRSTTVLGWIWHEGTLQAIKVSHQLPSKAFVHSLELTKSLLVSSSTAAISCPLSKKQLLDISPRIRSHGLSLLFKHSIPQSLHCPLHKLSLFHDLVTTYGL